MGIVDGSYNKVLQHLDVVTRDNFGIDLHRYNLFGPVHHNRDHATASTCLDPGLRHLLLQTLLHLLSLFHHLPNVHCIHLMCLAQQHQGRTTVRLSQCPESHYQKIHPASLAQ